MTLTDDLKEMEQFHIALPVSHELWITNYTIRKQWSDWFPQQLQLLRNKWKDLSGAQKLRFQKSLLSQGRFAAESLILPEMLKDNWWRSERAPKCLIIKEMSDLGEMRQAFTTYEKGKPMWEIGLSQPSRKACLIWSISCQWLQQTVRF